MAVKRKDRLTAIWRDSVFQFFDVQFQFDWQCDYFGFHPFSLLRLKLR